MTRRLLPLLSVLVLLVACRRDKPDGPTSSPIDLGGSSGGVYVVNEGNFQFGNAQVSYYDIATDAALQDIYRPANDADLGDVLQSMSIVNELAYLVVNNSGKVSVVDPSSFREQAVITGLTSPRYLLPVSPGKAYVTDMYAGSVAVVDLLENRVVGRIACPGATEELVGAYGKAFVTNTAKDFVYVVDAATDRIVDSVEVGRGGNSIRQDARGKLWVLSGGGFSAVRAKLSRIDPATLAVDAAFDFPASASPWRLNMNARGDTLYYLDGGVFRMSIHADQLPTTAFVPADGRNFYGLGVDPRSGVVYAADAIDYVQRGVIYRYAPSGQALGSFRAGIIPSAFMFR